MAATKTIEHEARQHSDVSGTLSTTGHVRVLRGPKPRQAPARDMAQTRLTLDPSKKTQAPLPTEVLFRSIPDPPRLRVGPLWGLCPSKNGEGGAKGGVGGDQAG